MNAELRRSFDSSNHFAGSNLDNPSSSSSLKETLCSLDGACIEKLLLHCAGALESNDVTLAQQVMWVLNNIASIHGDPNQRLAAWFLRALLVRAANVFPAAVSPTVTTVQCRPMTVTELANHVDLTPWHRFGFCAANGAILNAVRNSVKVHILDFSIIHGMQWPTLIDALSKRPQGPPELLRITVPSAAARPAVPPFLTIAAHEVGHRLAVFAKYRNVPFEFTILDDEFDLRSIIREDETLIINIHHWLRYLPADYHHNNERDSFLEMVKELKPTLITISDESVGMDFSSLRSRLSACFGYVWIFFDALETFMARDSERRAAYEAEVGRKIENIVEAEDGRRIERVESAAAAVTRMKRVGFKSVGFTAETIAEVKAVLEEHAGGWGMRSEEDGVILLTWKGHAAVFATAWVADEIWFDG